MRAYRLLQAKIGWWQPGYAAWKARARPDPKESYAPIFYKIRIDQVTGHEATREVVATISDHVTIAPRGRWNWLRNTLTRMFRGNRSETSSAP